MTEFAFPNNLNIDSIEHQIVGFHKQNFYSEKNSIVDSHFVYKYDFKWSSVKNFFCQIPLETIC